MAKYYIRYKVNGEKRASVGHYYTASTFSTFDTIKDQIAKDGVITGNRIFDMSKPGDIVTVELIKRSTRPRKCIKSISFEVVAKNKSGSCHCYTRVKPIKKLETDERISVAVFGRSIRSLFSSGHDYNIVREYLMSLLTRNDHINEVYLCLESNFDLMFAMHVILFNSSYGNRIKLFINEPNEYTVAAYTQAERSLYKDILNIKNIQWVRMSKRFMIERADVTMVSIDSRYSQQSAYAKRKNKGLYLMDPYRRERDCMINISKSGQRINNEVEQHESIRGTERRR